jgi:hypothetical protein
MGAPYRRRERKPNDDAAAIECIARDLIDKSHVDPAWNIMFAENDTAQIDLLHPGNTTAKAATQHLSCPALS